MPTICALETSSPRASICLWRGGHCLFEDHFESDRHHHALLFEPLQRAVEILGDSRLDTVVIGTGPGSYGGTRIGIAAGQGLAMVHGCPAVGLSSLLALGIPRASAIGDARRGQAWHAAIDAPERPTPTLVPMTDLEAALPANRPVVSFDDPEKFPFARDREIRLVAPCARLLVTAWLALSADERAALATTPPQPAYLAPPHITRAKAGHPLRRAGR